MWDKLTSGSGWLHIMPHTMCCMCQDMQVRCENSNVKCALLQRQQKNLLKAPCADAKVDNVLFERLLVMLLLLLPNSMLAYKVVLLFLLFKK